MNKIIKNDVLIMTIIILVIILGKVLYNPIEIGDELIIFNNTFKMFNRKSNL